MYLTEGEQFGYTVVLTHQPGVREDETVDLQNDEVRIYLTSSQEVYQQDDETSSTVAFQQRTGHRTQLTINTDVKTVTLDTALKVTGSVTAYSTHDIDVVHAEDSNVEGPTPYIYVRYSTVNPGQASPVLECASTDASTPTKQSDCPTGCTYASGGCTGGDYYEVVCPLCTHEAYCSHTTDVIAGTVVCADPLSNPFDGTNAACSTLLASFTHAGGTPVAYIPGAAATDAGVKFSGCYDIVYNGFAPVYDDCSENAGVARERAAYGVDTPITTVTTSTTIDVTPVYVGYNILTVDEATGAGDLAEWTGAEPACAYTTGGGVAHGGAGNPHTGGCPIGCSDDATTCGATGSAFRKRGQQSSNEPATDTTGGYGYQPYGEPNGPAPGIAYGDPAMKLRSCYPKVLNFDGETYNDGAAIQQIIQRVRMGGEDPAWLTHEECWDKINGMWSDCAGNLEAVPRTAAGPAVSACGGESCEPVATESISGQSDFRMRADGSPVTRDVPRIDDYCRYCDKPGLFCDVDRKPTQIDSDDAIQTWHPLYGADTAATDLRLTNPDHATNAAEATSVGYPSAANTLRGRTCIPDTVNGGDTAPNSANWLNTNYVSGPSWRGDLSSGAQLVFDSTNWNVAQTVLITARQDDVYEPNVYGRGQDAYVHHYVVAQDINLQHTYYEDIDVNDVVISITDNDPAYVLQQDAEIEPIEGQDSSDAPELHLRLSSEPMYDVTIYVQSGAFLDSAGQFLPDDEQVVFQDSGQYSVCFDEETGLRSVTDTAVNTGAVGGSQVNNCAQDGTRPAAETLLTADATYEDHGYAGRFHLHGCDISGHYVTPESYKDSMTNCAFVGAGQTVSDCPDGCIFSTGACDNPPTRASADTGHVYDASAGYELPTGWSCPSYYTEALCMASGPAEGCAWEDEDYIWTTCDCAGFNDHPTGGADGAGADNGVDFGDTPEVDGFMTGTAENSGTKYPVCVTAANQAACEDVDATPGAAGARVWDAVSGCLDVSVSATAAGSPVERVNDGYGTDVAGSGETPALKEEQCTKTGNTYNAAAGAGFCTTKQGSLVAAHTTEAACVGTGTTTSGDTVGFEGTTGNPTSRGSCVEALQVTGGTCTGTDPVACLLQKHCVFEGGNCIKRTNMNAASKSMDLVCASYASDSACTTEGCTWDAAAVGGAGVCKSEKLGYDCNSFLTFTSTNWNSWQTVKVIAVDDDEDETVARPAGFDPSDIGYLIASRDWYYNSAGSKDIEGQITDQDDPMPAPWSPGTPTPANLFDRYGASGTNHAVAGATVTMDLSMFDTRFGVHINRYPWPSSTDDEAAAGLVDCHTNADSTALGALVDGLLPSMQNGWKLPACAFLHAGTTAQDCPFPCVYASAGPTCTGNGGTGRYSTTRRFAHQENGVSAWRDLLSLPVEDMKLYGVATTGGHVDIPVGYTSEPKHNCKLKAPHTKDALNEVCLDNEASWSAEMVKTFAPPSTLGASCGAVSKVTDTNIRQVTISRGFCQATEGRRFFHKDFMHQVNPTTVEWTGHVRGSQRAEAPSKLVTTLGQIKGTVAGDLDNFPAYLSTGANALNGEPTDMWTSAYARPDVVEPLGHNIMTMPTCPFTIKLETAPLEGATVAVEVFEDPELVAMRDHELYFYEEPTFRPGVRSEYECETHFPGSLWIAKHDGDNPVQGTGVEYAYKDAGTTSGDGSCFIQNVPYAEPATPADNYLGLGFAPRGGTSIEVMFTDADWDVPRRITAIALNDDVDEPDEYRGIFFNTKGCTGHNHNQGTVMVPRRTHDDTGESVAAERLVCVDDPLYNDAVISTIAGDGVVLSAADGGPKDSITVQVIDDDIADLVVLCGDNPDAFQDECTDATGVAVITQGACDGLSGCAWSAQVGTVPGRCIFDYEDDEQFIGSYDDSHPHNRWDEGIERRGANAEDGMSYSLFGGGISTLTDGITGDAGADESCDNCGYVSITHARDASGAFAAGTGSLTSGRCVTRTITPGSLNTLTQDETWAQDMEEGCYPDTTPVDEYCYATDPTVAADVLACSAIKLDGNAATCTNTVTCSHSVAKTGVLNGYDPYTDQWCLDAPTAAITNDYDATTGTWSHTGSHCASYTNIGNHARGFKGAGPAFTEDTDKYACTIHSRECHSSSGNLKDSEGAACDYGKFQIRLNSSPGVKKVKRHYTGSTVTETESELVYIVVTPDETPQTRFEPTSVTFTETGGYVNGIATQRWDYPIDIKVVPKDDEVDERMGVIVDFTAFSITQSHKHDEYWKYTTPYMTLDAPTYPYTGKICVPKSQTPADATYDWLDCEGGKGDQTEAQYSAGAYSGRIDGHTPYRHTIRTIHTMDNDYSGVRVSGATAQTLDGDANQYSHNVLAAGTALTAIEGGTFSWYSLQLDTKPHKVQRQTGTNPNKGLVFDATNCGDQETYPNSLFEVSDYFADTTDVTRQDICGSVEPSADYWVDVTVTQTIHVDLSEPASCPVTAPWGGGSAPPGIVHPRFPFNARGSDRKPFDELTDRPIDMSKYLTTCGGWQRDATYRFTASNWEVPQFVYLYAHNDKDAANAASGATGDDHVMRGGNELFDEGQTYYTTTLKHYVETEDTLDNIVDADKFVQWNKHGAIYTYGNIERFPFGYDRMSRMATTKEWGCPENAILINQAYLLRYVDEAAATTACGAAKFVRTSKYASLDETGYTTWGYSKYESLYGYGYFKDGAWSTEGCCSTNMGGAWGAYSQGISNWGTTGGLGGTDSNNNGAEFRTPRTDLTDAPPQPAGRFTCSFARPATDLALGLVGSGTDSAYTAGSASGCAVGDASCITGLTEVGVQCTEPVTANAEPRPYNHDGEFCTPTVEISVVSSDVTDAANVFEFCIPRFATSYQTFNDLVADETDRTSGNALKFAPNDVEVRVSDNDAIADQDSSLVSSCKQTQFVMWSDAENPLMTDSTGVDTARSAWLLDYNCEPTGGSGDAGGLPGYPTNRNADGGLNTDGDAVIDPTGR